MASLSNPPCPHELRPGITVCLRCQHAERAAQRAKQRQVFARGGAAVLSLVVIAAVGIAAVTSLRTRSSTPGVDSRAEPARDAVSSAEVDSADSTPSALPAPSADTAGLGANVAPNIAARAVPPAPTPAPTTSVPSVPAAMVTQPAATRAREVALLVPPGRTTLRDTMVAERAGDTVRVSFDLLLSRTRRPEKFEAIVRSTLPQVYGAAADSALRALPAGAFARAGDLITALPERGFHIPLAGGRTIGVWPVTRVGRDGPLVVAYRAVASR